MRRASTSSPESVSSRTARSGSSMAICRISLRFFSPPEKPSLRWRSPKEGSMPSFSIHSIISRRTSRTDRSMPRRADSAWRRNWMTDTPGISWGYWNARKMPDLARTSVGQSVMSSPW